MSYINICICFIRKKRFPSNHCLFILWESIIHSFLFKSPIQLKTLENHGIERLNYWTKVKSLVSAEAMQDYK